MCAPGVPRVSRGRPELQVDRHEQVQHAPDAPWPAARIGIGAKPHSDSNVEETIEISNGATPTSMNDGKMHSPNGSISVTARVAAFR